MAERPVAGVSVFEAAMLERSEAATGVFLLEFGVGSGSPAPLPGQFYQVKCGEGREHVLRRPLSAHFAEDVPTGFRLGFLVEVVGWGTERISALEAGEKVSMLGPLGRGFDAPPAGKALLVAGGIGVAPLFFLARELEKSGRAYDMLAGFKQGDKAYRGLKDLGVAVQVYTEDGSAGTRGLVSEGVAPLLGKGYDAVFTCGPEAMMSEVAAISKAAGIPCQVSLDSRMACGVGACRSCVKPGSDGRNLCVCTEGPVFDSRKVAWRK